MQTQRVIVVRDTPTQRELYDRAFNDDVDYGGSEVVVFLLMLVALFAGLIKIISKKNR